MLSFLFKCLRRGFVFLQIIALLYWFGLELAGSGTGILAALFHHRLTNADGFKIGDLLNGSPPPGPFRLTPSDRALTERRITDAFAGAPPKHTTLGEMRWLYQPKEGGLCWMKQSSKDFDPTPCNALEQAHPLFTALLSAMHQKTEVLMWEEVRGRRGDLAFFAFFIGRSGKPQILVDLSRVSTDTWDVDQGFVLKVYHGGLLTELKLGEELSGHGLRRYLVDDPGVMLEGEDTCNGRCKPMLLVYGTEQPDRRKVIGRNNILELVVTPDLEKRLMLFRAVLPNGLVTPKPIASR